MNRGLLFSWFLAGVLVCVGVAIGSCCGQANFSVGPMAWSCSDWDELEPEGQKRLRAASKAVINHLSRRELPALFSTAHPVFKTSSSPEQLMAGLDKMGVGSAGLSKAVLTDGRVIGITNASPNVIPVTCGSLRGLDSVTINVQGGIRQHAVIFHSFAEPPFDRMLTTRFDGEDGRFLLVGLDLNTRTYRGKGSDHYQALSERDEAQGLLLSAALHGLRAAAFSRRGRGITTKESQSRMKRAIELAESEALKAHVKGITSEGRPFEAFLYSAYAMQGELHTIISYVSKRPLGHETTPAEAAGYMATIRKAYPALGDELETLTLRAYEEIPRSKSLHYKFYDVRLPLRPEAAKGEPAAPTQPPPADQPSGP